jgi:hypothetical protein
MCGVDYSAGPGSGNRRTRLSVCLTCAPPGVVLRKEKVGVRSWLGIALTVISVVLIQLGKSAGM